MRKGEQTRAAILDAALDLASRDGLEGLTIGLIADRMQMSKSGVFAHFGSREDLQIAVIQEYHRRFEEEVFPLEVKRRDGETVIFSVDEHPRRTTTMEKLASLNPLHPEIEGFSITAGNSSGLNDGAAALVIASEEKARALGIEPLGAFVGSAVAGVDPRVMGIGPVPAVRKLLERTGVSVEEVDLMELNEAFASQSLAGIRELGIDEEKVNVNGGAIAIGHPLGMSGARLTISLLHELRRRGGRYGVATMCVGVGQGQAALFERS